jgi:hypothetical protein
MNTNLLSGAGLVFASSGGWRVPLWMMLLYRCSCSQTNAGVIPILDYLLSSFEIFSQAIKYKLRWLLPLEASVGLKPSLLL